MLGNIRTMLHCLATLSQEFLLLHCFDSWHRLAFFFRWEVSKCPHHTSSPITQLGWSMLPLITLLLTPAAPALSWHLRKNFPSVFWWLSTPLLQKILTGRGEQACSVLNWHPCWLSPFSSLELWGSWDITLCSTVPREVLGTGLHPRPCTLWDLHN